MKITAYRGFTGSEFAQIKDSLKKLPFRVSIRRATQISACGAIHILPHKSSSPNRRWTLEQFEAVRKFVDENGISETGTRFLHSENAHYVLAVVGFGT